MFQTPRTLTMMLLFAAAVGCESQSESERPAYSSESQGSPARMEPLADDMDALADAEGDADVHDRDVAGPQVDLAVFIRHHLEQDLAWRLQ